MKIRTIARQLKRTIQFYIRMVNTMIPAYATDYDPDKKTITANVPFNDFIENASGDPVKLDWVPMTGVPVRFARAGGFCQTQPIKDGDKVMLLFSQRPLGEWFASDGKTVITPEMLKTHGTDCIAVYGLFPEKDNQGKADKNRWILSHDDGGLELILEPSGKKIHAVCDRLNIGAEGASTSVARGDKTGTNFTTLMNKINEMLAAASAFGGLIPPGSVLPLVSMEDVNSGKAYTND